MTFDKPGQARDVPERPAWPGGVASAPAGSPVAAFLTALERLSVLVESETRALQSRARVDFADFNHRKSHGLLELSRAARVLGRVPPGAAIEARLRDLRLKLSANQAVLRVHLGAVREVSTAIAQAMQAAESDGTYSASGGRGGVMPW